MSTAKVQTSPRISRPPTKAKVEPRRVPLHVELLAGKGFVERSRAAAAKLAPVTPEALAAFASGPDVSGGVDEDPSDV